MEQFKHNPDFVQEHDRFGNSSIYRAVLCPASPWDDRPGEPEPEPEPDSKEALEGSQTHEGIEVITRHLISSKEPISPADVPGDTDLVERVVRSRFPYLDLNQWEPFCEMKLPLWSAGKDRRLITFGRVDFLALSRNRMRVYIQDTKTGWGGFNETAARWQGGMCFAEVMQWAAARGIDGVKDGRVEFLTRDGEVYKADFVPADVGSIIAGVEKTIESSERYPFFFRPSANACQYCKRKPRCQAYLYTVSEIATSAVEPIQDLGDGTELLPSNPKEFEKAIASSPLPRVEALYDFLHSTKALDVVKRVLKKQIPVGERGDRFGHYPRKGNEYFPDFAQAWQRIRSYFDGKDFLAIAKTPAVSKVVKAAAQKYAKEHGIDQGSAEVEIRKLLAPALSRHPETSQLRIYRKGDK